MISRTTRQLWREFERLPLEIQEQARAAYRQFHNNPYHPGLRFRRVHAVLPVYSARVSRDYRAVGRVVDGVIFWFRIGGHEEYDALLRRL